MAQAGPCKVLFCGRDMHFGFQFTKEALRDDLGVEVVQCERADIARELANTTVIVPLMSPLDAQVLRSARQLKLIIQFGVGVEAIDIPTATELGIWVSNIPSGGTGNAISCAEHAIYLMLATLRFHDAMADSIRTRRLGVPLGQSLFNKTVLSVGFGSIAKELAVRLKPFGVRVTALRRRPWRHSAQVAAAASEQLPQHSKGESGAADAGRQQQQQQCLYLQHDAELDVAAEAVLVDRGCWPADSARLAADADIIAVTCHQDASNRGMIGSQFLSHCKPGVRIVNVARGGLLDYEAVRVGLDSGRIAGLGLDVQEHEPVDPQHWLAQHPSVYLTPHIAGVTEMSYRNMAEVVAAAVRRVRQGQAPARLLNDPHVAKQTMP